MIRILPVLALTLLGTLPASARVLAEGPVTSVPKERDNKIEKVRKFMTNDFD